MSLVATTSKAIKSLHDLKSNFSEVGVEITHLLSQVSTIQSSVQLIQQWLNLGPPALQSNAELRNTIEQALDDCIVIISAFEKHVARIRYSTGKVPVKGKIRHLFDQEELTKNQQAMGYQMQALTLLLQAIQMTSVVEQQQLMAQRETRTVLKWIRDDASSYIDPRLEQSSILQGTIMSNDADPDAVFDFDDLVLDSQAYKSAFRSFMKKEHASRSTLRDIGPPQTTEALTMAAGNKLDRSSPAIGLPVTGLQTFPQAKESEEPTEIEVETRMLESPKDSGQCFSEPPTGAGLGASNSIRSHLDSRATTATISTSVNSTGRGSSSGTKETSIVSDSSATLNSRPESDNLGTNTNVSRVSDPSNHIFLLSEAFPSIPDDLGHHQRPVGVLRLRIIKSDLTNYNRAGNPNSYVRVMSSGGHKGRTLVAQDNTAPSYNEVLYIPIDDFQGKLTMQVVDMRRPSTDRSLGTVTIDPLDYVWQSQEGEYVSQDRRLARRALYGGVRGTVEFEASFYPCVRLVCTESEDGSNVPQEPMAVPRLPSKVFLRYDEALSYNSGVLFFKLDWISTPTKDTLIFVDNATYPSYVFDARTGSISGIGSCWVQDVLRGKVRIQIRDSDRSEMLRMKVTDLFVSDNMSLNDQSNYYKVLKVPNFAPGDKTFELRLSSFFFPISLPFEDFSDAGILRVDVIEGRDFARALIGKRINLYCALFVNESEAYRTKLQEKGPHQDWNETCDLKISSRTEDKVKMRVMEYPAFSWRPHKLIGERDINISDFSPFTAETCFFYLKSSPSNVRFRVLFQPDLS
ncbi:hypothetical protein V8F33_013561 [Rhypophila sp. PSN 637]